MKRSPLYRKALLATAGQYSSVVSPQTFHKVMTVTQWQLGLAKPPEPPKPKKRGRK